METHFENISNVIINHLEKSQRDIKIAVAWIKDGHIRSTLLSCLMRGVKVTIIFYRDNNINDLDFFEDLYRNGASINFTRNLMHNKFCVIDHSVVINGSYNWTLAARRNHENIQITKNVDVADKFIAEFEKILKTSESAKRHFEDNEQSFKRYLNQIGYPISYPLFFKQELSRNAIYDVIGNLGNRKHLYILINSYEDYIIFQKEIYQYYFTEKTYLSLFTFSKFTLDSEWYEGTGLNKSIHRTFSQYLILDILLNIEQIRRFSIEKYLSEKIIFSNERFVYFDEHAFKNFILIGISGSNNGNNSNIRKLKSEPLSKSLLDFIIVENTKTEEKKVIVAHPEKIEINDKLIQISKREYYNRKPYNRTYHFNVSDWSSNQNLDSLVWFQQKDLIDEQVRKEDFEKLQLQKKKRDLELSQRDSFSCYIATMAYKDNNHPKVLKLRNFRDNYLQYNYFGKIFIINYYKYAPKLVEKLQNNQTMNIIIKEFLNLIIKFLPKNN